MPQNNRLDMFITPIWVPSLDFYDVTIGNTVILSTLMMNEIVDNKMKLFSCLPSYINFMAITLFYSIKKELL